MNTKMGFDLPAACTSLLGGSCRGKAPMFALTDLLSVAGRGGAYASGAIVPVDGGVSVFAPPPLFGERS